MGRNTRTKMYAIRIPHATDRCCPSCGSTEVDFKESWYGDGEAFLGGDYKFYEYTCDKCECVFREIVEEVPIGVQIKGKEYE